MTAACGGDPARTQDDPLDGYLAAVADITATMTGQVFAAAPPGADPSRGAVAAVVAARRTAADAVAALDPDPGMAPEHLALTGALDRLAAAGEVFLDDTATLDEAAFLAALEASTGIDTLVTALEAACAAWERRTEDLGHPTVLSC